jgi:hypothetical protein
MRISNLIARSAIAVAGAWLIPATGWACPACIVGDPKTAATYFGMTVVMSALPILLVCGIGYWVWRQHS